MLFWSKKHCSVKIPGCRSILALLVMGATCSKANDETVANNFKILASQTPFTETEVESLYELYRKLSSSITKNGYIDKEEFQLAVFRDSKQKNLFLDRMFVLFDVDGNGHIEFGEFVCSLGVFHPKAPREAKIKYLFELYDLRRTGFIEHEEVKEMVLALLQESDLVLDGDAVGMIVDKTFTEADTKCDGRIDEEEWKEYVDKNPSMLKNMTLPHLIDINQAFPSFVLNTEAKDL